MIDLVIFVVSVALVDSINPSSVVPALYLGTGPHGTRAVIGFGAGMLLVTFGAGAALLILGNGIANRIPRPAPVLIHWGEVALGVAALVVAAISWRHRHRVAGGLARIDTGGHRFAPLGGATIAALELPTAFPYFAVIAAIAASQEGLAFQASMLLLFNVLVLTPIIAIAVARIVAGARAVEALTRIRSLVLRHAGSVMAAVFLVLGIVLIALGAFGLASSG